MTYGLKGRQLKGRQRESVLGAESVSTDDQVEQLGVVAVAELRT